MPECAPICVGPMANPAWDKRKSKTSIKCRRCGTVFPENYYHEIDVVEHVCLACEDHPRSARALISQ